VKIDIAGKLIADPSRGGWTAAVKYLEKWQDPESFHVPVRLLHQTLSLWT
jgi:hypothetical protein